MQICYLYIRKYVGQCFKTLCDLYGISFILNYVDIMEYFNINIRIMFKFV